MKSFKQKVEEKRKRLEAERLLAEEKEYQIQRKKEDARLEQERLDKIEQDRRIIQEDKERQERLWQEQDRQKRLDEEQKKLQEERDWQSQLESHEQNRQDKRLFRLDQKDAIKDILHGEDRIRENIKDINRQIEIDRYEEAQIEKIEEEINLWEQEKISELSEKAISQLDESQLLEFEAQQKILADQQKDKRESVNKILSKAQNVLDSRKESAYWNKLSGLHDYIYRLGHIEESDPRWTDRKQPMSILTWEEWKVVPSNNVLIEIDFKRAKLLFEQDNMRAKRYHDHMWHWRETRYLAENRDIAHNPDETIIDIPYTQLIEQRFSAVEEIGDIVSWLDASDTSTLYSDVTESITLSHGNFDFYFEGKSGSQDLSIINSASLIDGERNTSCQIINQSSSAAGTFYWPTTGSSTDANVNLKGTDTDTQLTMVYTFPTGSETIVNGIEFLALSRSAMPAAFRIECRVSDSASWLRSAYANSPTVMGTQPLTTMIGAGGHRPTGGPGYGDHTIGMGEEMGSGSKFGIDGNGSASIDTFRTFLPRATAKSKQIRLVMTGFSTGSNVLLHGFNLFTNVGSGSQISNHGDLVHQWKSKAPAQEHTYRTVNKYRQRHQEVGAPRWYSGSNNIYGNPQFPWSPDGGTLDTPYVHFSSQSVDYLMCDSNWDVKTPKTTIFVARESTSKGTDIDGYVLAVHGSTYRERYSFRFTGFYRDIVTSIWDIDHGSNSTDDAIKMTLQPTPTHTTLQGDTLANKASASAWPYAGHTWTDSVNHSIGGFVKRKARIYTMQLERDDLSVGAEGRLWIDGGVAFINDEAKRSASFAANDYVNTGSDFRPTIGGYVSSVNFDNAKNRNRATDGSGGGASGDMHLYELIHFSKTLNADELNTVHQYLSDKWQMLYDTVKDPEEYYFQLSGSAKAQESAYIDPDRPNSDLGIFSGSNANDTGSIYFGNLPPLL